MQQCCNVVISYLQRILSSGFSPPYYLRRITNVCSGSDQEFYHLCVIMLKMVIKFLHIHTDLVMHRLLALSLMDSDLFKPRSQSFLSSMIDYGGCGSTWSPLYTMKRDAFHEMNPFDIFARPHPVLI